jgi:putative glutamine amidotransferase
VRPLVAVIGRRAASVPILRFSATLAAEAMCEAVWAAGGEPVVVHGPSGSPTLELPERLARFDAILLPGGADVDPLRYGQDPVAEIDGVVSFQDDLDLAVARAVVLGDLPTLAICRGMQVLNVALGGTLHQHLTETTVGHRNAVHDVTVERGSRLHAIVSADRVPVSSYHHQAVDRIAADLVVTARADDGTIEAVEHRTADVVAVQWHPEDLHATSTTDAALFGDLVERATKRRDNS